MSHRLPLAITLLAALGSAVTAYLTIEHGQGDTPACIVGHGCTVIATSKYAHIGDLPTASLGLLTYLTILLLAIVRLGNPPPEVAHRVRQASLAVSFSGTTFSAWLMYVALIDLNATCLWCITSATTITLIFLLTLTEFRLTEQSNEPDIPGL